MDEKESAPIVPIGKVDVSQLPQALACVIEELPTDTKESQHSYYSDQPSYDHSRES